MSVEAEHGLHLIPNSPIVRETYGLDDAAAGGDRAGRADRRHAIPYDAVWDCVTCGACVEACPVLIEHVDKIVGLRRNLVLEESRFPPELNGGLPGHGGRATRGASRPRPRTDWTKRLPFEVPTVAGRGRRRRARRARGPVLGRLRGGVRRAQPEGGAGVRDVPPCGRRSLRDPGPGGVVHGRPGPADGQRLRVPDPRRGRRRDAEPLRDGRADDRHRVSALLQHDRQRVRPARRQVPGGPPLRRTWPSCWRPGASRRCPRTRAPRPATIGRGASPSTTRAISPATTA